MVGGIEMKTIQEIKQYVSEQCLTSENLFGPSFFKLHLEVVENYSLQLADQLSADREVVEVAALIHDMAAISDFSSLLQHAEKGAEMADELLKDMPLSPDQKEKIKHCIHVHSKPIAIGSDIPEAVCISNADTMAQITQPMYWTFYIFGVRRFSYEDGRKWYEQRVADNWNELIEPAQRLISESYQNTNNLFRISHEKVENK
jgi:putative nucleotidyltransferase with HDIG domain